MITCVYVCVCSCVCVYLCILLAVSVCTNDYVCVCVFMCVCVWLYITMLVCTCANKNVCCLLSMCELRLRMGGYERIWACVKMQLGMCENAYGHVCKQVRLLTTVYACAQIA